MRHKHADVIHAWAEGEEIECKYPGEDWKDIYTPCFSNNAEYRIKPKKVKKEGWVNVYHNLSEAVIWVGAPIYSTKENASMGNHNDLVACIRIEWEEEE